MARRPISRVAFALRRASGVLLLVYLGFYLAALRADGMMLFAGDVGRSTGWHFRALEVALIAILTFHATEATLHALGDRFETLRNAGAILTIAFSMALIAAAAHVTFLFWT